MNVRNNFLKKPIPIIFGVKSFKLKKEYPELDAAVRTLGKCIEKNNELKRKQKELTRLDEVHTMLTGLIYEGRN